MESYYGIHGERHSLVNFVEFDDEQEDLMVRLAELDKELEVMMAENEMYESYYNAKTAVRPAVVVV